MGKRRERVGSGGEDFHHDEKRMMKGIEKQVENCDEKEEEDCGSDVYREALEQELRRREEVGTTTSEEETAGCDDGGKCGSSDTTSWKLFGMPVGRRGVGEKDSSDDCDVDCDEILRKAAILRI